MTDRKDVPFIDLEKVIASKSPRLPRLIPGFLIRYLKRVIHQEDVNEVMSNYRDLVGLEFIEAVLNQLEVVIEVKGLEYLGPDARFLLASNHPLGGIDGMALMKVAGTVKKDIVFPVNDLLMNIPNLRPLFIPINKHGSNAQNIKTLDETFASDRLVLYFPAGLCSRKIKGKIIDLQWKKTFIGKARRYKRDILPVHIDGRNSNFFYNLANWRKRLRIKANIEMLYLVDEMFKQKDKAIRITFGKPIPYQTFDKSKSDSDWSQLVKRHVYQLGKGVDDFARLMN
ncbi:MAG: 1-acyl-sn-glycerol-3-phosphate acyltransferase [Bacteroidetes bacterium]|nr:1-acyl-sn-glycerol-3-phosphate acyltransferase [Bacteroidota bacterium]